MCTEDKKLVAILGGRLYKDSLTLRVFLPPPIRQKLKANGIDFIIASNNPRAADQFEQIKDLKVIRTSEKLHDEFLSRQREERPNLGAETRETINQYAKDNGYNLVLHLDDNIKSIFYQDSGKNKLIRKYKTIAFFEIIQMLFFVAEHSNSGAVGIGMSAFAPSDRPPAITAGFPYSFFAHRVDKAFYFENSTEDDIIMSIYNGSKSKPSSIIRNSFYYGKTGKKSKNDGNRTMYNLLLKENKRGEYIFSQWPEIYSRRVSWNIKSSTKQKDPMYQHKHTLVKPKQWDKDLEVDREALKKVKETLSLIIELEK